MHSQSWTSVVGAPSFNRKGKYISNIVNFSSNLTYSNHSKRLQSTPTIKIKVMSLVCSLLQKAKEHKVERQIKSIRQVQILPLLWIMVFPLWVWCIKTNSPLTNTRWKRNQWPNISWSWRVVMCIGKWNRLQETWHWKKQISGYATLSLSHSC